MRIKRSRYCSKGRADLIALARELLYHPNWAMDAAQKLGVDTQFGSVPSQQAYWLAKRAQSVKSVCAVDLYEGHERWIAWFSRSEPT
jgi:2,4-dienoyl-CoA reductase-like NADH-dependent reductase (Old Yellow Enzyme family)